MFFEIEPNIGIRGLPLGSPKETVRRFVNADLNVVQRTADDNPADYWAARGVFAYYDAANNLEALEFASPARAMLHGLTLTGASMERATTFLRSLDPNVIVEERGASVRSNRLCIGLWCPTPDERDAAVETVLVGTANYFS